MSLNCSRSFDLQRRDWQRVAENQVKHATLRCVRPA